LNKTITLGEEPLKQQTYRKPAFPNLAFTLFGDQTKSWVCEVDAPDWGEYRAPFEIIIVSCKEFRHEELDRPVARRNGTCCWSNGNPLAWNH
jgi:hypothetical protein